MNGNSEVAIPKKGHIALFQDIHAHNHIEIMIGAYANRVLGLGQLKKRLWFIHPTQRAAKEPEKKSVAIVEFGTA